MTIRKSIIGLSLLIVASSALMGVAYAAFTDQSKFSGARFSVGSADLKLLDNLYGGTDAANLVDTKPVPSFDNIAPAWYSDYLIKIYNNGTQTVTLTSNMDYLTANDPASIREVLYMEPFEWNDADNDGQLDDGEQGISYSKKTFISWKSTGFNFGQLESGKVKSLIMRFSAGSISSSKMGAVGVFDFMFDSVGI